MSGQTVGALGMPRSLGHILVMQRARDSHYNAAVFVQVFYRQAFPKVLEILFVVLPAWRGMGQSFRIVQFPCTARVLLLIFSAAVVGTLVSQNLIWWQMCVWDAGPFRLPSLMPLALAAPAAYLLLTSLLRHTGRRAGQT